MDERWPWMDFHPGEDEERALLQDDEPEECWECGRLVGIVSMMTCPGCGEENR